MQRQVATIRALGFAIAASMSVSGFAYGHGTLVDGRMFQMRKAGPNGHLPAAWNESYYTWNQNSNNFAGYAGAGFSYSSVMPNGLIAAAGINDGVQSGLNFAGLGTASPGWGATAATAGGTVPLRFIATAPHDPSFFQVYITKPGVDASVTALSWAGLDLLGRWSVADSVNHVTFTGVPTAPSPSGGLSPSYDFTIPVPAGLSGRAAVVVIWQRQDPAGEAFVAVQDLMVTGGTAATPGDYNGDGRVDAADYTVWADRFGSTGPAGDGNGDGRVDGADYTMWADHFGQGTPPPPGVVAIPEPAGLAGLLIGLPLGLRRRR